MQVAEYRLRGTAPLMTAKFSTRIVAKIQAKHRAGGLADKAGKGGREARDFERDALEATYRSETWAGINASAFRCAMISACRLVGYKMTLAKLSIHVIADGLDDTSGTPLVRIHGPDPEADVRPVRNASGVMDLRARPMWRTWEVRLKVRFNAAQFTVADVARLLQHAGECVGVGEGRPDSRESAGIGYGTWELMGV
jgi:hypothetical protein